MDERDYYLAFSVFPGVGPKRFVELLSVFGSAEASWTASEQELTTVLGNVLAAKLLTFRKTFSIERYLDNLAERDVAFLAREEPDYPALLRIMEDAPIVLYFRGDLLAATKNQDTRYIGVVGTRKITDYGRQVTTMLCEELVTQGVVIVSGLALGVDAVAHQTTITCGGKTIAVLGSGVDVCHPQTNRSIYQQIIAGNGAVVSEYGLGEPPSRGSFPSRNRIIAGLSHGVVVTEGAADSGALYTAHDAFQIGREVYAVPGPITSSLSKGPNALLAQGAKLITCGADILRSLGVNAKKIPKTSTIHRGESVEEEKIISLLMREELLFDELVRHTGFAPGMLSILLSQMELRGIVICGESGTYFLRT